MTSSNPLIYTYGAERRWVCWRYETRDGKKTKVPVQPSGAFAKSNDVSTWSTYDEVTDPSCALFDGVGIMFTPERTLLGVDLDHIVKDGELVGPERDAIGRFIREANTYTEVSPSGAGLHLYFILDRPVTPKAKRYTYEVDGKRYGYELYTSGRFFTVTGAPYGEERPLRTISGGEAKRLLSIIGYPWAKTPPVSEHPSTVPSTPAASSLPDDDVLLERIRASKHGDRFTRLWGGDTSAYGGDDSAADLALLRELALWTQRDAVRMERLWLASPLGSRSKTKRRADYRRMSIDTACAGTGDVYEPVRTHTTTQEDGTEVRMIEDVRNDVHRMRERIKNAGDVEDKERKEMQAALKSLENEYLLRFHEWFAHVYPHILYERGEDKVFWSYNTDEGIYEESSHAWVRGLLAKLLMDEGLHQGANAATTRDVLVRYRGAYTQRCATHTMFDADSAWLHVANGWLHLETLVFKPHTPSRLSLRKSPAAYDPDATCPTYDAFLDTDLHLKPDAVRVLDQYSGLILTTDRKYQRILTIIGAPGCGKSTLVETWRNVLGDMAAKKKLSEIGSSDRARFMGSSLIGRTMLWFDEVDVKKSEFDNDLIDKVSGDTIEVERKGIDRRTVHPNGLKPILTANNLPYATAHGIYRRLLYIPITRGSFADAGTVRYDMPELLRSEASGILNRMLRGLADLWRMGSFTVIDGHDDEIEEVKRTTDPIAEFLEEFFDPILDWDDRYEPIPTRDLCAAYRHAMGEERWQRLTPARFGRMMSAQPLRRFAHIRQVRTTDCRKWQGLILKRGYSWSDEVNGERHIVRIGSNEEAWSRL